MSFGGNTMNSTCNRAAVLIAVLSIVAGSGTAGATVAADSADRTQYDQPAQGLGEALQAFGRTSGLTVVVESVLARGLKAPPLRGAYTPAEALELILSSSGLRAEYLDARTVAIRAQASSPAEGRSSVRVTKEDLRLVRAGADAPPGGESDTARAHASAAEQSTDTSEAEQEDKPQITVTGSRIRGLLGEQSIQPVLTITREDIERYGVSSLGEVLRYVPQVSSAELGQYVHPTSYPVDSPQLGVTANRISATLRGAPQGGTLLLVNGRRVPKTGQGIGSEAFDLGGIPLSAVERIDVLLDGASAVYGADAVGGVINVILRESYSGTEARVTYENTFDSDVSQKTVSLTHGLSLGRFSALLSASWEDANEMMWRDRSFLRSFDRSFLGGVDMRFNYGGAGLVRYYDGGPLPGLSSDVAAVPAGSDGQNVTVADYASAGPLPPLFDEGDYAVYSSPYERRSATASADYAFNDRATVFVEGRWGRSRTWSVGQPIAAFDTELPAGAPGNPFGESIYLSKYFYDLPLPRTASESVNYSALTGLRGELPGDWRYEVTASDAHTRPDRDLEIGFLSFFRVANAFAGGTPPILAYDSTSGLSPNPPDTIKPLTAAYPGIPDAERSQVTVFDWQMDGPLFALPAGEMRASVGLEYRDEHVDFPVLQYGLDAQVFNRYTTGAFAELRVPLVDPPMARPLLNRLEASLAVRHDQYSDFASSTNLRYGLLYRPVSALMLRGSYGEGYKVPTLTQLHEPASMGETYFSPGLHFDAERGGETIDGFNGGLGMPTTFMGNSDLRPERSRNFSLGAIAELPFLPGLSWSVDYFDTRYIDRVGRLSLTDRILLLPQTVMRGANLPGDPAGWSGPVIGYQDIAYNIAVHRISGYDVGMKYRRDAEVGAWTFNAVASKVTRNESRAAPHVATSGNSVTFNLPLQANGSLFWERGALDTGILFSYRARSFGSRSTGPLIPSATRWDWQISYDFPDVAAGGGWWGAVLSDTRIGLTIFNVLDTHPPLRAGSFRLPDNTVLDSRLRRYAINFTRRF